MGLYNIFGDPVLNPTLGTMAFLSGQLIINPETSRKCITPTLTPEVNKLILFYLAMFSQPSPEKVVEHLPFAISSLLSILFEPLAREVFLDSKQNKSSLYMQCQQLEIWKKEPTIEKALDIFATYQAVIKHCVEHHTTLRIKNPVLTAFGPQTMAALLEAGADINAKTADNNSALMKSANNDNVYLFKFLLARGADLKCVNNAGQTVIDIVYHHKNTEIMALLESALRRTATHTRVPALLAAPGAATPSTNSTVANIGKIEPNQI